MVSVILGAMPRLKPGANTNIVIDGNSIYTDPSQASVDGTGIARNLLTLPGFELCAAVSTAVSGQTWPFFTQWGRDVVDDLFVEGMDNISIIGECTNSAYFLGLTGAEMWEYAKTYLAQRKASHPGWKRIICGSIPYLSGTFPNEIPGGNQRMLDFDALMKAEWRDHAEGMVDYRTALTPMFNHDGSQRSYFEAYDDIWDDEYMHPNKEGMTIMAQAIVRVIRRLPA